MTKRIIAIACLAFTVPLKAQDFATSFDATEVAPGVYMLTGAEGKFGGGNMSVLVGDEQVVLIDDAMVPTAQPVLEAVNKLAGRAPDFVINTHIHGDHVGGNALMQENGSYVVAHDNIRKRLTTDSKDAGGDGGLPIITFSESVTFHVNGHELYVFHVHHAHTDGDGVIHFRDQNVIHAGDILFNNLFPFIDLDNGGSVEGFINAQKKLIAMADGDTVFIAGHGELASKADVEKNLAVLVDGRNLVKALVDRGMTEEEVLAANPLAKYHDDYNWSFITTERMTTTHYRDLTSE
jgi:glyoxylase-like metal-dependent hydrolase (beta-lactamase superfamily II)